MAKLNMKHGRTFLILRKVLTGTCAGTKRLAFRTDGKVLSCWQNAGATRSQGWKIETHPSGKPVTFRKAIEDHVKTAGTGRLFVDWHDLTNTIIRDFVDPTNPTGWHVEKTTNPNLR